MRNLKKVLSVLLVVVMIATAMVPAFAAETYTYSTQAKALYDVGLFNGISTTEYVPDLASSLNREQGFKLILSLLGKADEAKALTAADADAALAAFSDAKDVEPSLKNYVAFAVKSGLVKGDTSKLLNAKGAMLGKDFATVLLRQLGYADTEFAYDTATATLAEKGGLSAAEATKFASKELIRDDAVGMMYAALQAKYKTGETIIAQLVAGKDVDEAKAIAAGVYVKPTAVTATAAATGASKITVTFSAAVDSTKASITVKKGTVAVNTDSVVFAADNKSAVVTTTTKLSKGDYTVSVAGLTDTALTTTVTAEDEKVAKINITSAKAPRLADNNKKATVSYEVLNQYSEKMKNQTIAWTISTGDSFNTTNTVTNPTFEITAAGGLDFIPGAIVYITGVHAASGTVVNGQAEIALAAQADSVTFKGVWDKTNSKLVDLPAGFAADRYVLLFTVNDQYGNAMSAPDLGKLVFTSNNPLFVDASSFVVDADVTIDSTAYKAVVLKPGTMVNNGGTVTIQAISTVTGKISTYTATAQAKAEVKTFTMSALTDLATEGKSIYVPFTAVDQYGNAVTKYSDLNTKITLNPVYDGFSGLQFEQQDDNTAKLKYTAPVNVATKDTDYPVYLTTVVANGGNFSSLMVNVKDAAVPTAVVGLDSDVSTSVAAYNYVDIKAKNLIIQDQYGRTIKDADVETWLNGANSSIVVTSKIGTTPFTVSYNTDDVDLTSVVLTSSTDLVRINAEVGATATTATESVVFTLSNVDNGASVVDASAKSLSFAKVEKSAYTSYEVADPGLMYNDSLETTVTASAYDKTLKVYGVKADGTKVLLPATDYTVSAGSKLATSANVISDVAANGYVAADFKDASNVYTDVKVNVLVTVNDSSTGSAIAILTKELVLSNKAPKIATVTLNSDKVTDGKAIVPSGAISTATFITYIKEVKDQYAVKHTDALSVPVITITNLTKVSGSNFTVSANGTESTSVANAKLGDKFTVEFKYASGVTATVNFTVGK